MEMPNYIPADEAFVKTLEAAYKKQLREFKLNIRAAREFSAAEDAEDEPAVSEAVHEEFAQDDEPEEKHTPEEMEFALEHIEQYWRQTCTELKGARTAQDQVDCVNRLLREAFQAACYTGNSPLMPRFFDQMINAVAEKYEEPEPEMPEGSMANVTRFGEKPNEFFERQLGYMCDYTDLTLDALVDIENLTHVYERAHGVAEEEAAYTPYDVALRRYCKARKLDPEAFDQIPEADKGDFLENQKKFYLDELFAPFNEVLPEKVSYELAWFMGSAIEAVRKNDRERAEESILNRYIGQAPQQLPEAANDNPGKPYSFVAAEDSRRFAPKLAPERSIPSILADPKAMEDIRAMLEETFEDFPNAATSVEQLADAKHYFNNMFLDGEYSAREASPAR